MTGALSQHARFAFRRALSLGVLAAASALEGCDARKGAGSEPPQALPDVDRSAMQPQVASALAAARQAVIDNPSSANTWGNYGCLLDAHELAEPAAICYRRAHELDPSAFRWPYLLGTVVEGRDVSVEDILGPFEAASRIDATYAPLHHRMGEVLSTRGRLAEARAAYERALELDDSLAVAHRSLGQTLLMLDEPDRAMDHLTRADALSPDDRTIKSSLAQACRRMGKSAEADAYAARSRSCPERVALPDAVKFEVRQLNISMEHCRQRALEASSRQDQQAALAQLGPCREVTSDDPYFHSLLGQTLAQIGRHDLAAPQLERVLTLDPAFPGASFVLATSYINIGRVADAEQPLRQTLARTPDHASARARLGTVLTRTGRFTDAVVEFDRAAQIASLDDVAEFDWANAQAQTGAVELAIVHYQRTIHLNPRHADAHYNLGVMLERTGKTTEAANHYRAAMSIDPNHRAAQKLAKAGVSAPAGPQSSSP